MRASWPTKSKEQEQEQGFSLPEMLIALALMGMLGYFTTKFVSSEQLANSILVQKNAAFHFLKNSSDRIKNNLKNAQSATTPTVSNDWQSELTAHLSVKGSSETFAVTFKTFCRKSSHDSFKNVRLEGNLALSDQEVKDGYGSCILRNRCPRGSLPYIGVSFSGRHPYQNSKSNRGRNALPSNIQAGKTAIVGAAACFRLSGQRIQIAVEALGVNLLGGADQTKLKIFQTMRSHRLGNLANLELISH